MTKPNSAPRVRRFWRMAIYGAVIIAIVGGTLLGGILRGPTQGKLLYYQYRVASTRSAPGQIVFQFSPLALDAVDPSRSLEFPIHKQTPQHADDGDDCELLPPHVVPLGGAGESPELDMYNCFLNFALTDGMQVLFAHELTGAAGDKRIVIVEFGPDPRSSLRKMAFEVLVIKPATFSDLPVVLTRQRIAAGELHLGYLRTTCYAGERDGQDPASFHLAIEQAGTRRVITGILDPTAKRVEFREDPPV